MSAWSTQTYLPAIEPRDCPCCGETFPSGEEKLKHQRTVGHFRCAICHRQFLDGPSVVQHQLRDHKKVEKITCPGCLVDFASAGSWLEHVEHNQCKVIFPGDLEIRRQQLQAFRTALADKSPVRDLAMPYQASDTWADYVPGPAYDNFEVHHGTAVEQNYKEQSSFPRLPTNQFRAGDSKVLDLLSGDVDVYTGKAANAWSGAKSFFPKRSYNAVPPPAEHTHGVALYTKPCAADGDAVLCKDPYDPRFNPDVFKNPILDKFKCPHLSCSQTDKFRQVLSTLTGGILDAKINVKDENGDKREISIDELRGDMTEIVVDERAAENLRNKSAHGGGLGF
ncbi:uncharacterized protein B0I36DRAFT_408024 [Microdochium trichocladiopsis]|uniref:C2H2-type domain-containing protein n=1 Tax=Microdochium trichocladiopsis TaxID=1682393 RepID=A0A9P8YC60_9PEZI|nr:uncharacterized protein B0I36DRAFT_408024 [Microdochium trichocladiopsis]KAH7033398.1 hypothetical protein B0I36DRAFT_408024 [Microdochium trichocladiopsis]